MKSLELNTVICLPLITKQEIDIEEEIGRGCSGVVFKGKCRHATVAVKILVLQKEESEVFDREVVAMLQIRHPNIISVMGASSNPEGSIIVTEYFPNKDIQSLLDKSKATKQMIDRVFALKIALDIATGMYWLHCSQIVHRNLKPTNVLLDQYNNAKIADFGLSFINPDRYKTDKKFTDSIMWIAPESLLEKSSKPSVDVYSFSIILYQLLTTSALPYKLSKYKNDVTKFAKDVFDKRKRPKLPVDIGLPLANLIEQAWSHDPELRPTFGSLITDLNHIQFLTTLQYDDAAITMWSKKFGTQTTVNVDELCAAVFEELQEKVPEAGCKDVMISQKYNCLRTLVKDTSLTASPKKKQQ
jgi:serine/threonine-protein kinase TNNI3K